MNDNSLKQYIDLHDEQLAAIERLAPAPLNALRKQARQVLDEVVLPRKGSDDYEATRLWRECKPCGPLA